MSDKANKLAIDGGKAIRAASWPHRRLFGAEEKQAAIALFDSSIEKGEAFGYGGEEEIAYCNEFSEYLGGGYSDAVNSGTTAVYVALRSLELEPFTEVIVPPITDPGGVMPVPLMGCIPIPADTAPGSYNTGAEQIAERITERTSAILVAHIAGLPCDMAPIMELAKKHGLPVVEDCAQAHGATYHGQKVGTFGEVSAFSTMFGKHHASGGQGGFVFTRSEERYQRVRWMADRGKPFGLPAGSGNVVAALNHNNDELACAIGRVQLRKLPEIVERRRKFVAGLTERCRGLKHFEVVGPPANSEGAYWFLFVKVDWEGLRCDKDELIATLGAENIPFGGTYLHVPTWAPWFRERRVFGDSGFPWTSPQYKGDANATFELPNALAADAMHIRLPMHEGYGDGEAKDIAAGLAKMELHFAKD